MYGKLLFEPMPNRASKLTWEESEPRTRDRLTRSAVVEAAIGIADSSGLDAVSIRRLAAELGVRPMSLYTHIASKDDLLELMVNAAIAGVLVPEPLPESWREALGEIARRSHAAFLAHPWILEAYSRRPHVGPNALRHAEQSAAAVADLGLDPHDAEAVLGIVDDYAIGHALRAIHLRDGIPELPEIDPGEFPQLARLSEAMSEPGDEQSFEIGLDAVLDGVAGRFGLR
jgi:AcrR family transcriptional regulator